MTYKSKLLSQFPNIIHGFTDRSSGILRFAKPGVALKKQGFLNERRRESGDYEDVITNREKLAKDNGFELDQVVMTEQVHGNGVVRIRKDDMGRGSRSDDSVIGKYDAMITDQAGPVLVVKTADCVSLLFYASQKKVVGVAHAGWQGLAKNIIHEVVQSMINEYNIDSSELLVAIGPSICVDHYDVSTVGDDRIAQFEANFSQKSPAIRHQNGRVALDLPLAAKIQLLDEGIPEGQIEDSGICTFEYPDKWPSYRRDPKDLERPIWSFMRILRMG